MNLLTEWESLARQDGGTLTAALREMSAALGANYTLTSLSAWRTGRAPIPQPVQRYMRHEVLLEWCRRANFDPARAQYLLAAVEPPERMRNQ